MAIVCVCVGCCCGSHGLHTLIERKLNGVIDYALCLCGCSMWCSGTVNLANGRPPEATRHENSLVFRTTWTCCLSSFPVARRVR
uniref:Putative secreted protein n=1 Tax=Anopheles marajoara TaxID=58244 RepID=A0A2M4CAU5_9DIPT